MFPEQLETERLAFERLSCETTDVFELYECSSRHEPGIKEATEYLSWNPHQTPKDSMNFIEHVEEQWEDHAAATYVVRPREGEDGAGEFAGTCGLTVDWDRRVGNLGMWLRKPFWGRGYSGERAAEFMRLAFDRLDLEVVEVFHSAGNEKSRRAIEKYVERFGGRHEGRLRNRSVDADGEPIDQHRYTVTREEYVESVSG